jgi:hypothetical protein
MFGFFSIHLVERILQTKLEDSLIYSKARLGPLRERRQGMGIHINNYEILF